MEFGEYLNTAKAIQVILGIFLSVPLAFLFGSFTQWVARVVFTFNYKPRLKYTIGLFGGLAITSIFYFMLFKGMKDLAFMTKEVKQTLADNQGLILLVCFVVFSVLMQLMHWCKVNVFKIIVFVGTFALAMAFAGNDLVNFIGVPLAGFDAFLDFTHHGGGLAPSAFMMTSLEGSAKTPIYFLFIAGFVMVYALMTSKKARRVTETEVSLSSKNEGEELFGSSGAARSIVRLSRRTAQNIVKYTPEGVARWVNSRFAPVPEDPEFEGASYDLVRASINLCMASLLIALGTSLKLPLSTTFVTFMVAMGSSLADRAWTRESAVFRITGVLSVIGGWFMTAGAAFGTTIIIAFAMYFGGKVAIVGFIALSLFLVINSQIKFSKKAPEEQQGDTLFQSIITCQDQDAVNTMLAKHLSVSAAEQIDFFSEALRQSTDAFFAFALKPLRRLERSLNAQKRELKNLRRRETLCLRRTNNIVGTRLGTPFHLLHNNLRQILSGLMRINEPALEHVDNNFTPVDTTYALRFCELRNQLIERMDMIAASFRAEQTQDYLAHKEACDQLCDQFRSFRHEVLDRVQDSQNEVNLTTANLFLHVIQETEQVTRELRSILDNLRRYYELMD